MKKILVIFMILMLICMPAAVCANGDNGKSNNGKSDSGDNSSNDSDDSDDEQDGAETENAIENKTNNGSNITKIKVKIKTDAGTANSGQFSSNITKIQVKIKEQEHRLENETAQVQIKDRAVLKHQNTVRMAVQAFLIAREENGGLGANISTIAREFNNSVSATTHAELRIQSRSSVIRFFVGGDGDLAREINREVAENNERIRELERIIEECECSDDVKSLLREQLVTMEEEQERLRELTENELSDKGVIGWIWK